MSSTFLFPTPQNVDLYDDFAGVRVDTTAKRVHSAMQWGYDGDGSVTVGTAAAGSSGNVGNVHLLSGDVDTNAGSLFLGNAANSPVLHTADIAYFEWRIRMGAIGHCQLSIGLGDDIISSSLGANALGFFIASDGSLLTYARASSSELDIPTGVTIDAAKWYRLIAYPRSSTAWRLITYDQDGAVLATSEHDAHVPNSTITAGAFAICVGAGSGEHVKIDTFALRLKRDGRL